MHRRTFSRRFSETFIFPLLSLLPGKGPWSRLVMTSPSHGEGPGFESPRAHHKKLCLRKVSSKFVVPFSDAKARGDSFLRAVFSANSFIIARLKEFLPLDALRASVKVELSLKRELTSGIQDSLQRFLMESLSNRQFKKNHKLLVKLFPKAPHALKPLRVIPPQFCRWY